MKILLVEDHIPLLEQVQKELVTRNFHVETATTYPEAEQKIGVYEYSIVILDINLPGGSGLNLIKKIKSRSSQSGIIIISARDATNEKIRGLDLGADDYLTKPFDSAELLARVKSVIRRSQFNGSDQLAFGNLSLDTVAQAAFVDNIRMELTKTEFKILLFFFSNPRRVLTREGMAEHVWGDHMDMADSFDFIYSHIKNLRKKIREAGGGDPIKVVYGVGYKLDAE